MKIIFKAPAKINLLLNIIGFHKSYNLHQVETVLIPLEDIYDIITVVDSSKLNIFYHSNDFNVDNLNNTSNDLCSKVIKKYSKITKINIILKIDIQKNIPLVSGMGGGSSDAAGILLILNFLFKRLDNKQLLKFAFEIGIDVSFFLCPRLAFANNFGEKLIYFDTKLDFFIVIIYLFFPIKSSWAYNKIKINNKLFHKDDIIDILKSGELEEIIELLHNDFFNSINNKFPILDILKNDLLNTGEVLKVGITGSGSAIFGICKNIFEAKKIVNIIKLKYNNLVYCKYSKCLNQLYSSQSNYYLQK